MITSGAIFFFNQPFSLLPLKIGAQLLISAHFLWSAHFPERQMTAFKCLKKRLAAFCKICFSLGLSLEFSDFYCR